MLDRVFKSDCVGKSAEADWARLFMKLGLDFEYEPHLFEFGNGYGFCPDFYFPDQRVYVEVTVTRHIGRKNKKLRFAQEAFPDKTFVLLTRHEHRFVFGGDSLGAQIEIRQIDAWTQIASNLQLLCSSLFPAKSLSEPLTPIAA